MVRTLFLRGIFVGLLAVAAWLGYGAYKEVQRGDAIQEEIMKLRSEQQKIRRDNIFLQERIEYLKTDDFQEQEAKEKLNYHKEGEKVVIIKSETEEPPKTESVAGVWRSVGENSGQTNVTFPVPPYRKWWQHFFN